MCQSTIIFSVNRTHSRSVETCLWYNSIFSPIPRTVVCHQPVFFVSKPHPTLKHGNLGLENFDQNQNEGHICPLCPSKKKICQRPLPRPKRPYICFPTLSLPFWSIFRAKRIDINGIRIMPEVRYGFHLYTPFKKIACYYWNLGIILAFLPKNWLSKWSWFLKVGLRGAKLKK